MKGLRNILVHAYGRVDDRLAYEAMTSGLEDFETFKAVVLQAVRKEGR